METIAVTGAFGYTGKYITRRLLSQGYKVITITNSVNRENEFGNKVKAFPFGFNNPEKLSVDLKGVDTLINTYWVRFNHKLFQHSEAVENTKIMFNAAKKAGVRKIVHVSITNPSLTSNLEYFNGKAVLEKALMESGLEYTILRPAVIFGEEDILMNNIAWLIRNYPVFGIFGKGDYKLQPIFVDDMAKLAVESISANQNYLINAIGPETFTYKELVVKIMEIIGIKRPILHLNPTIGYWAGWIVSRLKGDFTITREEIKGLMDGLLYVNDKPAGDTKLTDWIVQNKAAFGTKYANELTRRKDRSKKY